MSRCKYDSSREPRYRRKGAGDNRISTEINDYDYGDDELEFLKAMDRYIRTNNQPFPTWSEALKVLKSLGYTKAKPT